MQTNPSDQQVRSIIMYCLHYFSLEGLKRTKIITYVSKRK